jgi:outer membrane beta-barrel protein
MNLAKPLLYAAVALPGAAFAAEPSAPRADKLELGVLENSDLRVVQNPLFTKKGKLELGAHLGWMPLDALVTTPQGQLSLDAHVREALSVSVLVGGGYGLKTGKYLELESPAYGVAPYAFRYLASALVGVTASPIYAKMALGPRTVVHYDVYGAARVGATLEESVVPGGGVTVAPTVSLGVGSRFFLSQKVNLRFEVRDDLLVEYRQLSQDWHFKQNAGFTLGVTFMTGGRPMLAGSRK